MIIVRVLYCLKSPGAVFRALRLKTLWDLGYRLSKADADVYMYPIVKPTDTKSWEYVLYYVDDILNISFDPTETMKGL